MNNLQKTSKRIRFLFFLACFLLSTFLFSQTKLTGLLVDEVSGRPIAFAEVFFLLHLTQTNENGVFVLEKLDAQQGFLEISVPGYEDFSKYLDLSAEENQILVELGKISLKKSIDILTFDIQEIQQQEDFDNTPSGNLGAYRDPFSDLAAFEFRQINYKRRGADFDYQTVGINGLEMNDLENNRTPWALWGGLNDAFREQINSISISPTENFLPSFGGSTNFIIRPSEKAKSIQNSISLTNVSYITRVMSSYSSGKGEKGWSWLANSSYRWGDDLFLPGVFYNSLAFLLSTEKEISKNYSVSFTGFYSPSNRSGRTAITEEEANLAPDGTNYNPYWGYQNGEVRYSRIQKNLQPFFLLSNYFKLSEKLKLDANFAYRLGSFGRTRLDYYNQNDPEPNNPRYLPSNFDWGSLEYEAAKNAFQTDSNYNQINWASMYDANINLPEVIIPNANGGAESYIGKRANYILQEELTYDQQFSSNLFLDFKMDNQTKINAGLFLSSLNRNYYKTLNDLLGADFWLDIDRFQEFDFPQYSNETQNDLQTPNRIVKEGDRFGCDYNLLSKKWSSFLQATKSNYPLDYNFGLSFGSVSFQREGNYQKGNFPNNSLGKSDEISFFEMQSNAGLTYYLDGKKSVLLNAFYQKNAPRGEWLFPQARSNNNLLPDAETENLLGGDITFKSTASRLKFISTLYYYRKTNATERSLSLLNLDSDLFQVDFLSVTLQNVVQQFLGFEFGTNYKLTESFSINGGVAISEHEYRNNPRIFVSNDSPSSQTEGLILLNGSESYLKGLNIGANPQFVFAFGAEYRNPKFWFAKVSLNHFSQSFVQPNPLNRSLPIIEERLNSNPTLTTNQLIKQDEFEQGFSLNLGFGKSWRIKDSWHLRLNSFVNNIFDKPMQTWGYEQTDYKEPYGYFNKYSYSQGRTFFINLSLKK